MGSRWITVFHCVQWNQLNRVITVEATAVECSDPNFLGPLEGRSNRNRYVVTAIVGVSNKMTAKPAGATETGKSAANHNND